MKILRDAAVTLASFMLALVLYNANSAIFGSPARRPQIATQKRTVVKVTSQQQAATHAIEFFDSKEASTGEGFCTGLAIGPHAILTAGHCFDTVRYSDEKYVEIDMSMSKEQVVGHKDDGADHIILLLNGPAFRNIAEYKVQVAKLGEHVWSYGVGGHQYPPVRKDGHVIETNDPSDIDAQLGVFQTNLGAIPGDSGAAIYNDNGDIVGLHTYGLKDHSETMDFEMQFSEQDVRFAQQFDPLTFTGF